jgi:hypothetical protein
MGKSLELDIVNIVSTNIDPDGFLSGTYDADGDAGSPSHQVGAIHGLFSRPLDPAIDPASGQPDPEKACRSLLYYQGGQGHLIPLDDVRTVATLPPILPGETMVLSDFGNFTRYHADGSIDDSTTTTGGSSTGQSVYSRVAPDNFEWLAPWGRMRYDATGFMLAPLGGALLMGGYAGGILPNLGSYWRIAADMVEINGGAVTIGPTGAVGQPVAQAPALVAILGTIAQVAIVTQAVQACQAAIAGALPAISTQTAVG